jgi:hypothetical protein
MKKSVVFLFIAILTAILSGCIISSSPSNTQVISYPDKSTTFQIKTFPNNAKFTWELDGTVIEGANTDSYQYLPIKDGVADHTLIIKATDIFGVTTKEWKITDDEDVVTTQTIGPDGGTMLGPPSSMLTGVKVVVPSGALSQDTEVSLGYSYDPRETTNGTFSGINIELNFKDIKYFNVPIRITVPFIDNPQSTPIPYYVDAQDNLYPAYLIEINRTLGEFTFGTSHASTYTWKYSTVNTKVPFDTKFNPTVDGFNFVNGDLHTNYSTGHCFAMTYFAQWYFKNKKPLLGGLFNNYTRTVVAFTEQQIIASRIQTSYGVGGNKPPDDNFMRLVQIEDDMVTNNRPVQLALEDTTCHAGNHSVLAYKFEYDIITDYVTIGIYDPSLPNPFSASTVRYDVKNDKFDVYQPYGQTFTYDNIYLEPTGSDIIGEDPDHVLIDADKNFHGFDDAIINITSHPNNKLVDIGDSTISGYAQSGLVLVTSMHIEVSDDSGNPPEKITTYVDNNTGYFSFSVPIVKGNNSIKITPYYYSVNDKKDYEVKSFKLKDMYNQGISGSLVLWGKGGSGGDICAYVYTQDDLDALVNYSELDCLIILGNDIRIVDLPNLTSVHGEINVQPGLELFNCPSLSSVNGNFWVNTGTFNCPSLSSVNGRLWVTTGTFICQSLSSVNGSFEVYTSTASTVNCPSLLSVNGGIEVEAGTLNCPLLSSVSGSFCVTVETLNCPLLSSVNGGYTGGAFDVHLIGQLQTFNLDSLCSCGGRFYFYASHICQSVLEGLLNRVLSCGGIGDPNPYVSGDSC